MGRWLRRSHASARRRIPYYVEAVTVFAHADKAGRNGARQPAENIAAIGGIKIFIDGLAS